MIPVETLRRCYPTLNEKQLVILSRIPEAGSGAEIRPRRPVVTEYPSIPRGPSADYVLMLRGEISAEEYVKRLRQRIAGRRKPRNAKKEQ